MPSSSSRRNINIYKVDKQLFHLYYSLLTFFLKNNPKNWEFTNCLLNPPTYELGTFWKKSHHSKNKYYGRSIQITACLNLRRS